MTISSSYQFIERLAAVELKNVFNPYAETCPFHDLPAAANIRQENLAAILESALRSGVDSLWVGRDLGHKGGRRTGLPFTDEPNLELHARMFGVTGIARATKGDIVREVTAKTIWSSLTGVGCRVFLWNVFPFHPHDVGSPLSNRGHSAAEAKVGEPFLSWLVMSLKPARIVSIGDHALRTLRKLGVAATAVRHPSFGGQAKFRLGITKMYGSA